MLLSPLTSQEAVLSSKIEGTLATLGEVLEFEASEESSFSEKRDDIYEVLNYRSSLRLAVLRLEQGMPLSQGLVKETHAVLMQGVRGSTKRPGHYRHLQNLIGSPGDDENTARFVPPQPVHVDGLMANWEEYLNGDAKDRLIQLAVVHAEFEAIHPFLDGNGRTGRLLIPLFLMAKKLLSSPSFFVSGYLEANRDEYCERLLRVSTADDWTGWCEFFLKALTVQAKDNESKARRILDLYSLKKDWITNLTHSQYCIRALDWFFDRPIFSASDFAKSSGIPKPTAKRIVRLAIDGGLLKVLRPSRGTIPAILSFWELLQIAEGQDA